MLLYFRRRLTFANVVSLLALFVALGGSAYAVASLPKNSVGATQLKNNAVISKKIKAEAVTGPKLARGAVPRARWALIRADGKVLAQSGGISVVKHSAGTSPGSYFLEFGSSTAHKAIVATAAGDFEGRVSEGIEAAHCGAGTDSVPCFSSVNRASVVHVVTSSNGSNVDGSFYVAVLP
jgi:hypothetical protein